MSHPTDQLRRLLAERIVLLDGAWGVVIQRGVRGEEAYRGERFRDHPRDVAREPRPAEPRLGPSVDPRHPPASTSPPARTSRRRTPSRRRGSARGTTSSATRGRDEPQGAQLARQAADEVVRVRRRLGRAAERVALGVAARWTTRLPDGRPSTQVRDAYAEQMRGAPRGRRRPPDGRDDLRHAQREGGDRGSARRRRPSSRAGSRSRRSTRAAANCPARRSRRSGRRSSTPSR